MTTCFITKLNKDVYKISELNMILDGLNRYPFSNEVSFYSCFPRVISFVSNDEK